MRLIFVCDPPVNETGYNTGASQVIKQLKGHFADLGHSAIIVTKALLDGIAPGEAAYQRVCEYFDSVEFDAMHIATEGRLGFLARRYCVARGLRFTSAYHGQYPEFLQIRHGWDPEGPYQFLAWFHSRAERVLVPSQTMTRRITEKGIKKAIACGHGVDTDLFRPQDKSFLDHLPRPIWLYVGRLDPEKSVEDFLALDLPGTKLVVGDGSVRHELEGQFPDAVFVGLKLGEELAAYYAASDCFVFPSRTDTFGLVLLEALAAGLPVAAYPVTGPVDVITDPNVGCLDNDLRAACLKAINLRPEDCRAFALRRSWAEAAKEFLSHQVPLKPANGHVVSDAARERFERVFGPQLVQWEKKVVETEDLLFGAKAHNLAPTK